MLVNSGCLLHLTWIIFLHSLAQVLEVVMVSQLRSTPAPPLRVGSARLAPAVLVLTNPLVPVDQRNGICQQNFVIAAVCGTIRRSAYTAVRTAHRSKIMQVSVLFCIADMLSY